MLNWRLDEGDFVLECCETGGPPVTEPATSGFGSFLIRSMLAADFNGEVSLEYHPDGVACRLVTAQSNLTFRRGAAHHHAA